MEWRWEISRFVLEFYVCANKRQHQHHGDVKVLWIRQHKFILVFWFYDSSVLRKCILTKNN